MPTTSTLFTPPGLLKCPYCDARLTDLRDQVAFQWGKVPHSYKVGDHILWLKDKIGKVLPPFTMLRDSRGMPSEWNSGESSYSHVWAFDVVLVENRYPYCPACKREYDGVAVEIQRNIIKTVRVFKRGELEAISGPCDLPFDTIIVQNDGTFSPKPEWYNHGLSVHQ